MHRVFIDDAADVYEWRRALLGEEAVCFTQSGLGSSREKTHEMGCVRPIT
jgi:hypothetical protein